MKPPRHNPLLPPSYTVTPWKRGTIWRKEPENWYLLAAMAAVVLAGGGTPVWTRAGVLVGIGAWLVARPPREAPSRWFEGGMLALFAIAVFASFAPASWLGLVHWRNDAQMLGVPLPATNAPAPWLAGEALAQFAAGVAWLYACWNLKFHHETRKQSLWGVAAVAALLSLGAIAGNLLGKKYPLGIEAMNFSYFPNRNQSALWYCLGGVLAFGLLFESLERRRWRVMAAGGMLLVCMSALVMGRSRMAIFLFALGCLLVLLLRYGRESGWYVMRILVPMAIFGISLMVFFGHETLDRLHFSAGLGLTQDYRLELWRDTLNLVKAQPAGIGLDQFAGVFPQYRITSRAYQTVLHPDSDWVWLLGETGWAGLAAAVVAVGGLAAVLFGRAGRASGPYKRLAALCAGLFFLHTLVDVPAHRFGTWLLAAWFVSLAAPDGTETPTLIPGVVWRALGSVLMLVGLFWLGAVAGFPTNSTLMLERAQDRSTAALAQSDAAGVFAATGAAESAAPMQWWPYFHQAEAQLFLRRDDQAAMADFRRARFLEPTWARVPFQEGFIWANFGDPVRAVAAWREALLREDAVPEGLWRDIQDHLRTMPQGEDYASALSKSRPLFRFSYLGRLPAARFPAEWADELARDPNLTQYTADQRQKLIERWAQIDGAATLAFLKTHPEAVPIPWSVEIFALAETGQFHDAMALVRDHLPPVPIAEFHYDGSTDEASLAAEFKAKPGDLETGVVLLQKQLDAKEMDQALATLDTLAGVPAPPPFVSWWRADLLARAGRDAEAWAALQPYLEYKRSLLDKNK